MLAVKGPYTSKPRPWVVVQNDAFPHTNSITLCPFTHVLLEDAPLLRIPVEPSSINGLDAPSQIQVDKVSTVRRTDINREVGTLEEPTMQQLADALKFFLSL